MEVRFAADAAAASHSRYWKFEASARGQVTAQVYFLKGNVSFDPITKEAVEAWLACSTDCKVVLGISFPPHPPAIPAKVRFELPQ